MRITFVDPGSSTLPLDVHSAVGDRQPPGPRGFSPSLPASSETCGHGRSPLNRRVTPATTAERNCGLFGPLNPIRSRAEASHSQDEAVRGRTL
jgi:hypothetical protein